MIYRKAHQTDVWHFCTNCSRWPSAEYEEKLEPPAIGQLCNECRSMRKAGLCEAATMAGAKSTVNHCM